MSPWKNKDLSLGNVPINTWVPLALGLTKRGYWASRAQPERILSGFQQGGYFRTIPCFTMKNLLLGRLFMLEGDAKYFSLLMAV